MTPLWTDVKDWPDADWAARLELRTWRDFETKAVSCHCSSRASLRVLTARVGRLNNGADRFLVETFETTFALQVFQVAADGPFL